MGWQKWEAKGRLRQREEHEPIYRSMEPAGYVHVGERFYQVNITWSTNREVGRVQRRAQRVGQPRSLFGWELGANIGL